MSFREMALPSQLGFVGITKRLIVNQQTAAVQNGQALLDITRVQSCFGQGCFDLACNAQSRGACAVDDNALLS